MGLVVWNDFFPVKFLFKDRMAYIICHQDEKDASHATGK